MRPNWRLDPAFGEVSLDAGFRPSPYVVAVQSGGPIDAQGALGSNCAGFIAEAPDFRLFYDPGQGLPLYISVSSDADTTLVVSDPDGNWYCDDDSGGALDPRLWWETPPDGQYDIWIGTYENTELNDAELRISDIDPSSPKGAETEDWEFVTSYRDWDVFRDRFGCYATTPALSSEPRDPTLDPAVIVVSFNRETQLLGMLLVFSYVLSEDFYATAFVDSGRPFDFTRSGDEYSVLYGRSEVDSLTVLMRRGIRMVVYSVSDSGLERIDTLSLLGFTAATNHAIRECS